MRRSNDQPDTPGHRDTPENRRAVAICGLGLMGGAIARRLLDAGVPVIGWNRDPERSRELARHGARVAGSPAEAAGEAGAVITTLATPRAVLDVLFGSDGVAAAAPPVVIQMSTVAPADAQAIADRLPAGTNLLDAPVLGSVPEAVAGSLRILLGGTHGTVDRWRQLLELLGEPVHVGPVPTGSSLKQVVNAAVAPMVALLAEAVALGDRLGLDRTTVLDELERSRIGPLVHRKRDRIETGEYSPDVRLATFAKDMRLLERTGADLELSLTMATAAGRLAAEAIERGLGELDYSVLVAHALVGGQTRPPAVPSGRSPSAPSGGQTRPRAVPSGRSPSAPSGGQTRPPVAPSGRSPSAPSGAAPDRCG